MAKRVGVVLSGCGFKDGSEVHESVLTLLALDEAGAEAVCFAPDVPQARVVDHKTGKESAGEERNVLSESARIARGKVRDVREARAADLDAVVLPGGFGAALNLSSFATKGKDAEVNAEVARLLREAHAAKKPIGAVCIAPAVVSRVLGKARPRLTIGNDAGTAAALEASGAVHEDCPVEGFVVDRDNRIVSTPAYMYDARISDVAKGVRACVREVLAMGGAPAPAAAGKR
jgi:enhancing lycopene biosynthesis protein 2